MDEAKPNGVSREFCEEYGLDYDETRRDTNEIAERVEKECKGKPRKEFQKALTEAIGAYLKEKLGDKAPEVMAIDLSEGPTAALESIIESLKDKLDASALSAQDKADRCMRVFGDVVRALIKIEDVDMADIVSGLTQTLVNSVASGSGLRLRDEYKKAGNPVNKILVQFDSDLKSKCVETALKLKEIVRDDELRRN